MQTVKTKSLTERPSLDGGLQVTVRGCDHPNVSAYRACPRRHVSNSCSCKNAQQGNLGLGWNFSDFVQEERTAVC